MSDIKAGDMVRLKSGGPLMTVEEVSTYDNDYPEAKCRWFATGKKMETALFRLMMLDKGEAGPNYRVGFSGRPVNPTPAERGT